MSSCRQRQRERKRGARAHSGGRASVHTTNGENWCGQTRCRKAARGTRVAETGRTPAGADAWGGDGAGLRPRMDDSDRMGVQRGAGCLLGSRH